MSYKIVEARPEHVEGAQKVFYRTWLDTYPSEEFGITIDDIEDRFKDRLSPEVLKERREKLTNLRAGTKYLVALEDDRVIGLAIAEKNDKENRLKAIYVLPEHQGKGVGKALWQELQSFFDTHKDIVVGVATYNENAIGFYTKLGFVDTGRRYTDERLRLKSGAMIPEMDLAIRGRV